MARLSVDHCDRGDEALDIKGDRSSQMKKRGYYLHFDGIKTTGVARKIAMQIREMKKDASRADFRSVSHKIDRQELCGCAGEDEGSRFPVYSADSGGQGVFFVPEGDKGQISVLSDYCGNIYVSVFPG